MKSCDSIQGVSTLESLRGFVLSRILPSVLPATPLQERREGFTDLSRLNERNHFRSGQCYLPDKEFRSDLLRSTFVEWVDHFCQPLHVAMQLGLYLHLSCRCLSCSL